MFRRSLLCKSSSISSASQLLMRFPAKNESLAAYATITAVNEPSFYYQSTLSGWATRLREEFLHVYRAEPTMENIQRFKQQLAALTTATTTPATTISNCNPSTVSRVQDANVHEIMLLLSLCYQTATTPSDLLLSKTESLVPQFLSAANGSTQYLLQAVACYEFFAPHRLPSLLTKMSTLVERSANSLRTAELTLLLCAYANNSFGGGSSCMVVSSNAAAASAAAVGGGERGGSDRSSSNTNDLVFPPSLRSTLLDRALLLCQDLSAREVANLSAALAPLAAVLTPPRKTGGRRGDGLVSAPEGKGGTVLKGECKETEDNEAQKVRDAIHHNFAKRFVSQQELSTLRDAATMWWSLAAAGIRSDGQYSSSSAAVSSDSANSNNNSGSEIAREAHEACARRIMLMLRDLGAESFAKTICALNFAATTPSLAAASENCNALPPKSSQHFRAPRLLADLAEIANQIDVSSLHPFAALDAACAAAELGLNSGNSSNNNNYNITNNDALFSRLTARMLMGRSEILRCEPARDKLLHLASMIQ